MSSYDQFLQGKAIQTGCEWRLRFKITSTALAVFSPTSRFSAQFREKIDGPVLIELTTANGGIVRVDNNTLELVLKSTDTVSWKNQSVMTDIVRTDLPQKIHLGFDLIIPVKRSVTRV